MPKTKVVNEDFTGADQSPAGAPGSIVPDPVDTGDVHANRPQDNPQGEAGVAHTAGGDIPRSAMLAVLIQQLMGMDNADLASIVAQIGDYHTDNAAAPGVAASALESDQAKNLASVATHREDVEELFAGEDLSEEYKERAAVIFEAAVKARTTAEIVRLEEQAERDLAEAVEALTEEMATQIDKYLTYAAEQFVVEHKPQLEQLTRNTIAEQFIANLISAVDQLKIDSDPTVSAKVTELETAMADLEGKLNESVDAQVNLTARIKEYEAKAAFDEVAGSLSPIQRARFSQLAEGIDFDAPEAYKTRLTVIKESILKTGAPKNDSKVLTEDVRDGVPQVTAEDETVKSVVTAPEVKAALASLRRL